MGIFFFFNAILQRKISIGFPRQFLSSRNIFAKLQFMWFALQNVGL